MAIKLPGGKHLTEELRRLSAEAIDMTPDGDPITRAQALASLIWKFALGWKEKRRDENGDLQEVEHPPVAWAMQYLYERMEGKAPQAAPEAGDGIKAVDKVRKLAKDRLNALAGVTAKAGPPEYKPKQ